MTTVAPGTSAEHWLALRDRVPPVWARYTDLVVERGEGAWIETVSGERYLDYTSGIGVTNTGHAHPRVSAAIAEQAAKIIHAQQNILYHQPGLELHDRLPRTFPGLEHGDEAALFLANSGAEAIEAAVKLAKYATRRPAIVAFRGGFHGRTHAAMSLTSSGIKYRGHYEPLLPSIYFAPYPYPLRNPTGATEEAALAYSLAGLEELFATMIHPDDVAGILVEPVLGEGGYVVPPDGFLPALREIADRYGILLIADEVQSGVGRTGRMWATEWTDTRPDIVVMAKGIASGLPLSGIMARRELLEKFGPGAHGGTYGGNAVACAAALATLDVIAAEGLLDNARRQGERLLSNLRRLTAGHSAVAEVRGRGLMVALEFADPDGLQPRPDLAKAFIQAAFERKLLLLSCGTYGQVVRIIPPLITNDTEVDSAISAMSEALAVIGS
ncbi:MAG TPA: aminotransferase class III-fold pyridoxal phosphate-dependent enzyme [Candidatus Limnocylindria bacterium]|jgi:4-aminobutyrate aminotransferase|nr:aminotransferase class III-fold pyridoxal phosphate-dependent enzyme [Candidatus Limnocylindria bacterium]